MADILTAHRTPRVIHSWTEWFPIAGSHMMRLSPTPASVAWPAANRALYIPFILPFDYPVRRVFWGNGATVTGDADLGIYTIDGARIYSTGSIARTGLASVPQFTTVSTPFWLFNGVPYYIALAINATTTAMFGTIAVTAVFSRLLGILEQATALPLPATMTGVAPTGAGYPLVGFSRV